MAITQGKADSESDLYGVQPLSKGVDAQSL